MFSGPRRANGVQGLRFIIQSEKAPHYLESRVEAFLRAMETLLTEMNEEAFNKHIQALAIRRLDKPKKLAAECAKYWGEIISQQYNFDRGEGWREGGSLWGSGISGLSVQFSVIITLCFDPGDHCLGNLSSICIVFQR